MGKRSRGPLGSAGERVAAQPFGNGSGYRSLIVSLKTRLASSYKISCFFKSRFTCRLMHLLYRCGYMHRLTKKKKRLIYLIDHSMIYLIMVPEEERSSVSVSFNTLSIDRKNFLISK